MKYGNISPKNRKIMEMHERGMKCSEIAKVVGLTRQAVQMTITKISTNQINREMEERTMKRFSDPNYGAYNIHKPNAYYLDAIISLGYRAGFAVVDGHPTYYADWKPVNIANVLRDAIAAGFRRRDA
jgi:hypothetical protein